jgi:predicted nucleic acid-binding protein
MILDTSFIIDILRGEDSAEERLTIIERTNTPEKVAAITVLEVYEGIIGAEKPEQERSRVMRVLDSKHVISSDFGVMKHAGELSGKLRHSGEAIDREDCVIAATAINESEPVLTRNKSHFDRIPGLDVQTY